jgi:hypothetical protein
MDSDRGSARALNIAVNAKHIADVYRLVKAHGFNRYGRDTSPRALSGANAAAISICERTQPPNCRHSGWRPPAWQGFASSNRRMAVPLRFAYIDLSIKKMN